MKISQIIPIIPSATSIKTNFYKTMCPILYPLPNDTVEISPDLLLHLQARQLLSDTKKFNIDNYMALSELDKNLIDAAIDNETRQAAELSVKIATNVKSDLDKKYGKDNYVFVSVGTSPSGIARVLEFMGVETKYLPISGLSAFFDEEMFRDFDKVFPKYNEFLVEQGLSQNKISSSDKTYLFYDLTITGRSLAVFKKMLKENFGINTRNVEFHSLDYECCCASYDKKGDSPQYVLDYIKEYLQGEKIATYGGIPHLLLWELDKIDDCKDYMSESAKKFNFLVIHSLRKKKLLKQNPDNKNSL